MRPFWIIRRRTPNRFALQRGSGVYARARRTATDLGAAGLNAALFVSVPTPGYAADSAHETLEYLLLMAGGFGFLAAFLGLLAMSMRMRRLHHDAKDAAVRLNEAITNLPEGFAIFDAHDMLVTCNPSLRNLHPDLADLMKPGVRCEDLAQALCRTAMGLTDEDRILRTRDGLCRVPNEMELKLGDGRWILQRNRALPDGGKVLISTDITTVKMREQLLHNNAMRYRDMVERSPVPIYVHRDRKVIYANSSTARVLGYGAAEEIVGKDIFDLVHPDHHKLAWKRLDLLNDTDAPLPQIDMKFRRKDGEIVYTESQVSPVMFAGRPAFESILYDISSRRRAERALMESEQRYRNLFELSPDAILVHDGGSVVFANDAAARMLGADCDIALFGMNIVTFTPAGEKRECPLFAELSAPASAAASPATATPQTCQLRRLDGRLFDAEVVAAPTNHHGQAVQQVVIRDITRRKRMDATMAQNAKLASLGSMAAGLAHELSQPLNIMRFAAEGGLLKMSKGKMDDAAHAKTYRLIQDQSERMATIMDNMRIFSRKDPGPMQVFDVMLAARNICHLARNPFRVDDVHIQIIGPLSGIGAFGNTIQFEQVLLNLLHNARDSILEHRQQLNLDEPGRIVLECMIPDEGNEVVITVSDNGNGIDRNHLERIFDPFFTTKDAGKGTGLGLALSHEIITTMSGTLEARNSAEGAQFSVHLPLVGDDTIADTEPMAADPQEPAAMLPPAPPVGDVQTSLASGEAPHILVVEDETEAAWAMAEFLREEGFEVSIANNGRDGLEHYRTLRPDAVITDIRMPGMDGTQLIEALRAERADLPIIAVTGHMADSELIPSGMDTAPVKVMKKPVSLMALTREIVGILAL